MCEEWKITDLCQQDWLIRDTCNDYILQLDWLADNFILFAVRVLRKSMFIYLFIS